MKKELSIYKLTKTMSVVEFRQYCNERSEMRGQAKVIYNTENQERDLSNPLFLITNKP